MITKSINGNKGMTYFPLLLIYVKSGMKEIVNSPTDIKSGESFRVLKTRVKVS